MTISTTTTTNRYTGNAATTVFPYTFRILNATDLVVTKRLATTLVESTLVYPADYSVSGVGNATGGSVTLAVAPATGDLLVIERAVPATQPTSIRNQGSYFAETHENVFDRQTMVDQQQVTALGRTFKLPHTLDPAAYTMDLPVPVAGQVLAWSTNGLTNGSVSTSSVVLPGNGRTTATLTEYLANNYIYNVVDYDADPTGALDSLAAINAAIAAAVAAGGGIVFVPPGTYIVSATLTTPAAAFYRIVGAGRYRSTIKHSTGGAVLSWTATHLTSEYGCGLEDITISGNTTSATVATFSGHTLFHMLRVVFTAGTGGTGTALNLTSMWDSHFVDVYVTDCGNSTHPCVILDALGVGNNSLNNCHFHNLHVEPSDADAIYLSMVGNATNGIDDNKFIGLKLHGNPTSGNPARAVLNMSQYVHGNDFFAPIIAFGRGTAQIICDGQRNHFWGGTWGIGGSGVPTYAVQCTPNANANVFHSPTITTPNAYTVPNVVFRAEALAVHNAFLDVIGSYGGVTPISDAGRSIVRWADISTNVGFQTYASDGLATVGPGFMQTQSFINTLTDAATIAVNLKLGDSYKVILNVAGATRAVGLPTNPVAGQIVRFTIIQDATGGRALTWNAAFKHAWSDTGNTANKRSTIMFQYDGTNYNQLGAQSPYI